MSIFDSPSAKVNWSTTTVGTFFIKLLNAFFMTGDRCKPFHSHLNEEMAKLFSLPGEKVSIIDMAHLFSINDVEILTINSTSPKKTQRPLVPINPSISKCFKTAFKNNQQVNEEISIGDYYDEDDLSIVDSFMSPCNNAKEFPDCNEYCHLHENLTNKWQKSKLLTMLKYAIPQRKLAIDESKEEEELAKEVFGSENVEGLSKRIVPMSNIVFCYSKIDGYSGEDIKGMNIKNCNDFFLSPTDIGIGHTQNLDVKEILHEYEGYENFLESKDQELKGNITGGTYWSRRTLVILTDGLGDLSQTYPKYKEEDLSTIKFQIHQRKEFANMILNQDHKKLIGSLELTAGNEYTIDITPKGQVTTSNFKAMSKEKRDCLLEYEVSDHIGN